MYVTVTGGEPSRNRSCGPDDNDAGSVLTVTGPESSVAVGIVHWIKVQGESKEAGTITRSGQLDITGAVLSGPYMTKCKL